ncbi:MAG: SDR family oxidoreductase [Salinibacterium sp.]|nr:SDR family oxidoreductase [Salinibacterium sp.]
MKPSSRIPNLRTIAITGGLGDIGLATGLRLARDGHAVMLLDLVPVEEGRERASSAAAHDGVALGYLRVDVTDHSAVFEAIDSIVSLDTVIANAGTVRSAPFLEITAADWRAHLDVNLTGAFLPLQAAAQRFVREETRGLLLATSSWVAQVPWPEITAYTASKAGLEMLIKQAARELALYGIRANAVAPGIVLAGLAKNQVETEPQYAARASRVIPLGALQSAEQVAGAFSFLCSPDADYMTGTTLTIDGGASLFSFD